MKYRKLGHGGRQAPRRFQCAGGARLAAGAGHDAGAPDVVLTGADLAAIAAAGSTARTRYNEMSIARVKL